MRRLNEAALESAIGVTSYSFVHHKPTSFRIAALLISKTNNVGHTTHSELPPFFGYRASDDGHDSNQITSSHAKDYEPSSEQPFEKSQGFVADMKGVLQSYDGRCWNH